jgi:signal peptide peptidase SppA
MEANNILADVFGTGPMLIYQPAMDGLLLRAAAFAEHGTKIVVPYAAGLGQSYPRQGASWDGPIELPGMTVQDGLAQIPIHGYIGNNLDPLVKWFFDATDMQDVQREIAQAKADDSIKAVLFNIVDSPGGSARNVPETADAIADLGKPTASWVEGMAASASYWLPSASDLIYATRLSDIGSIGVYSTFYDRSKLYNDVGINVQVFASGKYKGAGIPGTSLTQDQAAYIQADVMELADEFKRAVRSGRKKEISDEVMQGQTMSAPKALAAGLIDGIKKTKEQVIQESSLR